MRKLIFITTLFLTSCSGHKKVIGNYYLFGDSFEFMALYYGPPYYLGGIGVVQYCVFAVGNNDKYIIAKQHPFDPASSKSLDKSITNYFIVPVEDYHNWSKNRTKIVPLSQSEFNQKRKELGIEDIPFTTVYKQVE
jgi:hypothetical protein